MSLQIPFCGTQSGARFGFLSHPLSSVFPTPVYVVPPWVHNPGFLFFYPFICVFQYTWLPWSPPLHIARRIKILLRYYIRSPFVIFACLLWVVVLRDKSCLVLTTMAQSCHRLLFLIRYPRTMSRIVVQIKTIIKLSSMALRSSPSRSLQHFFLLGEYNHWRPGIVPFVTTSAQIEKWKQF